MKSEIVEYHKLRPRDLVTKRHERPLAYLGLGILEWHGLHNPLGLDGVKANAIACYLARELGGVVMPPLFWGDDRQEICELVFDPACSPWLPEGTQDHTGHICREMDLKKEAFQADAKRSSTNGGWRLWETLMVHTLFQIETLGFHKLVTIPGHYPLFDPLDRAIAAYQEQGGKCSVFVLKDPLFSDDGNAGDHAAKFETSLMLALCPELVDLTQLDPDLTEPNIGVLGDDPRQFASKEFGCEILAKFVQITRKYLEEW